MLKDKVKSSDWWNEITSEEKATVEKGIEDTKAGRVKPHKEAKKLYEKWL
jgi:predicted transcriptional regulator